MTDKTTTITPAMCVAASDAAMERGVILPASHAGEIIEAAFRAAPSPAPAAPSAAQPDYSHLRPEGGRFSFAYSPDTELPWVGWRFDDRDAAHFFRMELDALRNEEIFPSPAQPAQGGSVSEAADDAPTYRIRITPDMTYDQINAAAAAEEARVEALTETAKRIAWEMRDRLSVQYRSARSETPDDLWSVMTQADRRAALSAARASQPVVEVVDRLSRIRDLAAEMGHADTLGFEEARERIIEEVDAALRSGEVR